MYLLLILNCTVYSVEKYVILNLTCVTHLGGDLHIFVKQLVMVLDPSKIQYLKSSIDGKIHGQIRLKRLQGAVSDLHAAKASYHDSCRKNFMLFKIKQANTCASTSTDSTFDKLVKDITSNKSKTRTFSDVHESYLLHGGKGSRKAVLAKLQEALR